MPDIIDRETNNLLFEGYEQWSKTIVSRIEKAKVQASFHVNADLLSLYWSIGSDILEKQQNLGWGAQVIDKLSQDLSRAFPDDRGYSVRNLKYMRAFAEVYPDFPIVQVPLAQLQETSLCFRRLKIVQNGHYTLWQQRKKDGAEM